MSWLHDQIAPVVDQILDRVMPVAEQKLDELKADGLALIEAQIPILMDKLLALLPMLAATVGKTVTDEVVAKFAHVLDADPDIPVISDVFDLSETIRKGLNDNTPAGIHIPILSDVLGGIFKR
jgi:hypothetical protein